MTVDAAVQAIQNGKMVLIYDFEHREGETDMVMPAACMTSRDVAQMRLEAGGLICVAIPSEAAERLCLPFMSDILKLVSSNGCRLRLDSICEQPGDLAYDTRSSFSISVNHRGVRTGITDIDRALTIQEIGKIVNQTGNDKETNFGAAFRSPGHVPLLRAARGLLNERKGQTELSIALANMAGICPAMTVCEMLDAETGRALTKRDSIAYAQRNGLVFVTGQAIVDVYKR